MFLEKEPDFIVCVQIKANSFGRKLEQEILSKTDHLEIEEQSDCEGAITYRWEFKTWDDAVKAVESLQEYAQNPNVFLLHARAVYDETTAPIVFKDERRPHRVNR